jgi:fatty-acyl-CoA synthase
MYIGDWLGRRALLSPRKLALVDAATGARYLYADLNQRANRLARQLRNRFGVAKGQRVAILAGNCVEYLDLLFACGKLGATLVPLNWRLAQPELAYIAGDCAPAVLAYAAEYTPAAEELRQSCGIPHILPIEAFGADGDAAPVETELGLEDPALILYTSGTTGKPKGAVLPQGMLAWNSLNTIVGWELSAADTTIVHTPFFHTGGINVLTLPLIHCGGTLVLMRGFDPARCLQLIASERVTVLFAVPTMFQMLLDDQGFAHTDFSSVRFLISGGAPCPLPLIRAYHARGMPFRQGYGLTEVGPNCFTLQPDDAIRKAGSVGQPNFHLDARIVDDAGREARPDAAGELVLRGPAVCAGYWNNPTASAAALRDGWFHTGDLARRDAEGYYFIVGRKKELIISGGENIYPAEVEELLYAHPAVAEAALIGVPDAKWGEVGRAIVALKPGDTTTADELISFCQGRIARYKLPKSIVFVEQLPRNAMGKVVKEELKRRFGET